jgi:hypothetical protein
LLPGEPPDSSDRDDVNLWIDVYCELCEMVRHVTAVEAVPELLEHLRQLEARRRFWLARSSEMPTAPS